MNCFAFNKKSQICTCLTRQGCPGSKHCVFYKEAGRAKAEAMSSPKYNETYMDITRNVIKMIDENQREYT